jgi:hypothetical protein
MTGWRKQKSRPQAGVLLLTTDLLAGLFNVAASRSAQITTTARQ